MIKVFINLVFFIYLVKQCLAKGHHTDHVILAHRWPISECIDWMQESSGNDCNVPPKMDWTIGGFWPYRFSANKPVYCNSSVHADDAVLKQLTSQLLVHWPSIPKLVTNKTLWRKEFDCHGSCAVGLPVFNLTENYFKGALQRLAKYNMTQILKKGKITPGAHYSVTQIMDAVKKTLKNVEPAMRCVYHNATRGIMLKDIYTCYDTHSGVLIDCKLLKGGLYSGCPAVDKQLVYYPSMEYPTPHKFPRALIAFLIIFFGTLGFIGSFFGYRKYLAFRERRGYNSMT